MFVPKEIAQNVLMGITPVARWAQKRHHTGVQQDLERAGRVYSRFVSHLDRPVDGLDVLELGPGKGTGLMRLAAPDVASYAAFDVEPYLSGAEISGLGIDYRVDSSGKLPWPDGSFDVVWSHSVLEHVRSPAQVLAEVRRVLRPHGRHIASIDLQDHYGDRNDAGQMYGFFRYGDRLWRLMTSNRSSFCNRLRASQWRSLVGEFGFRIESEEVDAPSASLPAFRAHGFLDHVSDDDLLAAAILLVTTVSTERS